MKLKPIHALVLVLTTVILYACASIGSPDGGPYDETPPKFVRANPGHNSINNKRKKVTIEFDEFIKLEKASEKVIISPPQKEMARVEASGKHVNVEFYDTLRKDMTYTIDFGDAIVDNNEGNPMGQFAYAFSTGPHIDTMEVAGTVLNAENLEPIKDIQVGLHQNLHDSAFTKLPFDRISRTDSRGRFRIRGIRPGSYRIYALKDGNQNYLFDSKTEIIAYLDSLVVPSMQEGAVRYDTVWNKIDTLRYDTIIKVNYTRFLPDDLILRAFKEENDIQYLAKSEREQLNRFSLYFNAKADTLPTMRGLNFDEKELVIEANPKKDTIRYWIKDSLLAECDTLSLELKYWATDTLGVLVPKTDTLQLLNKINKEKRLAMAEEARKKEEKERKKQLKKEEARRKKEEAKRKEEEKDKEEDTKTVELSDSIKNDSIMGVPTDSIAADSLSTDSLGTDISNKLANNEANQNEVKADTVKVKFFEMKVDAPTSLDINSNITLDFPEPIEKIDTSKIHISLKVDSLWKEIPFILRADTVLPRKYTILSDWQPEKEYKLNIDSLCFKSIYGLYTNKVENTLKVKKLDEYGTLYLNIVGADKHAVVQLLNGSDAVVRQQRISENNTCDFYFLTPGSKYYVRLFIDHNNNGKWDTGIYEQKLQAEEVYYFNKVWEIKANFDFEETWDIFATPADKQKLDEIKKQKPDETKKIQNRNKERAKKLGKAAS